MQSSYRTIAKTCFLSIALLRTAISDLEIEDLQDLLSVLKKKLKTASALGCVSCLVQRIPFFRLFKISKNNFQKDFKISKTIFPKFPQNFPKTDDSARRVLTIPRAGTSTIPRVETLTIPRAGTPTIPRARTPTIPRAGTRTIVRRIHINYKLSHNTNNNKLKRLGWRTFHKSQKYWR